MLKVVIWDVQHGSAAYIRTPNGTHIVQDLGTGDISSNSEEFSPLLHLKKEYKVERLHYVIITHPHKDHIDDILNFYELTPYVLGRPKHLTKDDILKANKNDSNEKLNKYFEINDHYNSPVDDSTNPTLPQNNGNVKIKVYTPNRCDVSNINNHSMVVIYEYGNRKIIIPGDNEPPSWEELLESESFIENIKNTDIFVAPHHGRESAYFSDLFKFFTPSLTIISDGPCDSSAVSKYSAISKGFYVKHRDGRTEERKCLTTRKDGAIYIAFNLSDQEINASISVSIE
jgi:competence protein ComEC